MYHKIYHLQNTHWWFEARRNALELLLKNLPRNGNVLDVGCGPGSMLLFLQNFGDVTGIDPFFAALKMARRFFNGSLVQGVVENLPFPNNCFDLIFAGEVLYHRGVKDVTQAIREMTRVLAPDGYLVVVDSAYATLSSSHDRAAHAARRFTRPQMCRYFHDAGMKIVHATYAYAALLPVVWIVRQAKKILRRDQMPEAELAAAPAGLNRILTQWFALESRIGSRYGLPFGLSIQIVGKKVKNPDAKGQALVYP